MNATLLVCSTFMRKHPLAAARQLEDLPAKELGDFLARVSAQDAAPALERISADQAAECLAAMETAAAANLLAELDFDYQIAILRVTEPSARDSLLQALDDALAVPLARMLQYPAGTVGELVDPFVLTVPSDFTVSETLKRARSVSLEMPFYVYVLDRAQRLDGVLSLKKLIRARRGDPVSALMDDNVVSLRALSPQVDMLKSPHWREFHTLPVTDDDDLFQGVVRYDTLARLRDELEGDTREGRVLDTVLALGELYWMGLSGVMDGISGRTGGETAGQNKEPEERA